MTAKKKILLAATAMVGLSAIILGGIGLGYFVGLGGSQTEYIDLDPGTNMVFDGYEDHGISVAMLDDEYSLTSVSSTYNSGTTTYTLTATPTLDGTAVSDASSADIEWEVVYTAGYTSYSGLKVSDCVTVTPNGTSGTDSQSATVECLAAFGAQMTVYARLADDPDNVYGFCTIDYLEKLISISLNFGDVACDFDTGETGVTVSACCSGGGGATDFSMVTSELYTISNSFSISDFKLKSSYDILMNDNDGTTEFFAFAELINENLTYSNGLNYYTTLYDDGLYFGFEYFSENFGFHFYTCDGDTYTQYSVFDSYGAADIVSMFESGYDGTNLFDIYVVMKDSYSSESYEFTSTFYIEAMEDSDHTKSSSFVEVSGKAATCSSTGYYYKVYYCSVCGDEVSRTRVTIATTDHKYVVTTSDGYTTYTCTVCGYYYTVDAGACDHSFSVTDVVEGDCDTVGYTVLTCDYCDYSIQISSGYVHDYSFTEDGKVIMETCADCDLSGSYEYDYSFSYADYGDFMCVAYEVSDGVYAPDYVKILYGGEYLFFESASDEIILYVYGDEDYVYSGNNIQCVTQEGYYGYFLVLTYESGVSYVKIYTESNEGYGTIYLSYSSSLAIYSVQPAFYDYLINPDVWTIYLTYYEDDWLLYSFYYVDWYQGSIDYSTLSVFYENQQYQVVYLRGGSGDYTISCTSGATIEYYSSDDEEFALSFMLQDLDGGFLILPYGCGTVTITDNVSGESVTYTLRSIYYEDWAGDVS